MRNSFYNSKIKSRIRCDYIIWTRRISCDKPKSQKNFSIKYGFQYPLLADVNKKLVNLFGVWGPKKFKGKEYDGIHRMTFIFDEDLVLTRLIDKVNTKEHADQIING